MTRLIFTLFLLLSGPSSVFAHSPLLSSSPEDGASVTAVPEAFEMRFKGTARLVRFTLSGEAAGEIELGKAHLMVEAQDHTVLLPQLGADAYEVRWRAMSADGHIIKGSLSFTIQSP